MRKNTQNLGGQDLIEVQFARQRLDKMEPSYYESQYGPVTMEVAAKFMVLCPEDYENYKGIRICGNNYTKSPEDYQNVRFSDEVLAAYAANNKNSRMVHCCHNRRTGELFRTENVIYHLVDCGKVPLDYLYLWTVLPSLPGEIRWFPHPDVRAALVHMLDNITRTRREL